MIFLAGWTHKCSEPSQRLPAQREQWILSDRGNCGICSKLTVKALKRSQLSSVWYLLALIRLRGSHRRCSIKKAVLKNFEIFSGIQLCWNLF